LPYFAGSGAPNWDPFARGTLLGLTLAHERAAIARAIMEGVSLETREILEAMEALGLELKEVRLTGGATKSPLWNQIQADIYGKPCAKLAVDEATTLGAAILGGVGAGVFNSLEEAVGEMVRVVETREPNPEAHRRYNELYAIYKDAYQALAAAKVYERLAKLTV
ncbi:MAG: Hsp70 family protein, partial [Clostridia bacterium]|nr:Hsp70 family protein [Clostridia bacterium]